MSEWSRQWDEEVAKSQDEMSLQHLRSGVYPPHWVALLKRLRELEPIGSILEVGCSTGYLALLLQKEGIHFASYTGVDTNRSALIIGAKRYGCYSSHTPGEYDDMAFEDRIDCRPSRAYGFAESLGEFFQDRVPLRRFDVVIDGACIMHVEDWRAHARQLGLLARRELIFSRLPTAAVPYERRPTAGHGKVFDAWAFDYRAVVDAVNIKSWQGEVGAAHGGERQVSMSRNRSAVTYYDANYSKKGALMQASHGGRVVRYETDGEDVETMWRLGPQRIRTEMQRAQSDITYVDADYYFFGPLDEYYAEVGDAPAAIIPHNMTTLEQAEHMALAAARDRPPGLPPKPYEFTGSLHEMHAPLYGTYNVGMVYFDNTVQGRKILDWWVARCAEWCHARVEDGKFGDQKYLDEFPAMGAKVIENVGVGMGPWSSKTLRMRRDGDSIMIGDGAAERRLLAWHFSTFRPDRWVDPAYGNCEWARPAYEEYAKAWEHGDR